MARRGFAYWNRKAHIYLGLYFLLFVWLFAISGLVLNHTDWELFKSEPVDEHSEIVITSPTGEDDFAKAREVMAQLGVTGEVHKVNRPKEPPYELGFSVIRPHTFTFVRVDLDEGVAAVRVRHWGFWSGVGRMHTFASMSIRGKGMFRDWLLTKVWSVATDALAVGVIVMLCGGIYMWWRIKPRNRVDLICLGAGILSCAFFVVGMRILFA